MTEHIERRPIKTILVVEDEAPVAEVLRTALETEGNSCLLARTADQAARLLDRHSVDAMTLDLGIPGIGGLEWLESIAEDWPDLAHKTLVITGRPLAPEDITRLARCGAGLLAKPFTLETLNEAVRTQLLHGALTRN